MGVNALRQARSQNQNLAETKTNKSSFCRKMRHEVTLKSEILSQLDFKSAAQDVVFNCLDGQVCLSGSEIYLTLVGFLTKSVAGGSQCSVPGNHLSIPPTTTAGDLIALPHFDFYLFSTFYSLNTNIKDIAEQSSEP